MAIEKISRLFVSSREASSWMGLEPDGPSKTEFTLTFEGEEIKMHVRKGRNPLIDEVEEAIKMMVSETKVPVSIRPVPFRYARKVKSSLAADYFIEQDWCGDGFPTRDFVLHVSGVYKVPKIQGNLWNVLDLFVAWGDIVVKDGFYAVDEGFEPEIQMIRPRFLNLEEGWNKPGAIPCGVVELETVRHLPVPDEAGKAEETE